VVAMTTIGITLTLVQLQQAQTTAAVGQLSGIVMTMAGHVTRQPIAVLESG